MKLMNEIKLKCDPGNILKTRDRKQNLLIFTLAPPRPRGEKKNVRGKVKRVLKPNLPHFPHYMAHGTSTPSRSFADTLPRQN